MGRQLLGICNTMHAMAVAYSVEIVDGHDAASGVVIYYDSATDADGNGLTGTYTLASGGTLVKN